MAEETKTIEEQLKEAQAKIKELEELTNKQKSAIDNACSDAAKQKKTAQEWADKYKEKLSEQEKADLEAKQATETLMSELNAYKQKERVATYTAKLLEAGYDAETAAKMAAALPEGVTDEFFNSQKSFIEAKTQAIKTQTLNSQPTLTTGATPSAQDAEDAEMAKYRKWAGI